MFSRHDRIIYVTAWSVKNCLTKKDFFCSIVQRELYMRVTGGIGRGRRLSAPSGERLRPTSDKVKQALFNIMGEKVAGAAFLDLYAGAGGIGVEALSRGASHVVFVDVSGDSLKFVRQNLEKTGFARNAEVIQADALSFLERPSGPYDIIFLDPPYVQELLSLLIRVSAAEIMKPDGLVIAEHFKKQRSPEEAGGLALFRTAQYGDTVLAFYK